MRKFLQYLKNSNVKLSIDLNPWVWGFVHHHERPTNIDPKLHIHYWRILFLSLAIVVDDGSYVLEDNHVDESEYFGRQHKDYL